MSWKYIHPILATILQACGVWTFVTGEAIIRNIRNILQSLFFLIALPIVGNACPFWDMNGNLVQVIGCKQNSGRLHEWDEENRLKFVLGEKYAGYYGYNANGERVYKLTGMSVMDQVNSGSTKAQAIFDEAVLYPNPYMVVTRKGYTKHYYAGTERLATVIGQGGFKDVTYPTDKFLPYEKNIVASFYSRYLSTYDPFYYHGTLGNLVNTTDIHGDPNPDLQYQCKPTVLEFVDVLNQSDMLLKSISSNEHINNDEKEKYFYHGDHLGSASWITDYQGNPAQYIHYAPYGELIADQQVVGYDERYKFTGKERDRETGYDMFGARYLWSDAGIFISPDPLSDKTPEISSYAYCLNNPLKYVDPDGKLPDAIWDAVWIAWDGASFLYNTIVGNNQEAAMDAACFTADGATLFVPGMPAVSGPARAGAKLAPKVAETTPKLAKAIDKTITATRNTYRKVLKKVSGVTGKGYEAHHTLPQKYRRDFEKLGINIDEPGNVVWRKTEGHRAKNAEHGKEWDKFFDQNPSPTKEQVIEFRDKTEQKVWGNMGDSPLQ